jgi:hypothetical protein
MSYSKSAAGLQLFLSQLESPGDPERLRPSGWLHVGFALVDRQRQESRTRSAVINPVSDIDRKILTHDAALRQSRGAEGYLRPPSMRWSGSLDFSGVEGCRRCRAFPLASGFDERAAVRCRRGSPSGSSPRRGCTNSAHGDLYPHFKARGSPSPARGRRRGWCAQTALRQRP